MHFFARLTSDRRLKQVNNEFVIMIRNHFVRPRRRIIHDATALVSQLFYNADQKSHQED